jgi:hypothetical protein
MNIKNFKLFESLQDSPVFESQIGSEEQDVYLTTHNEPYPIKNSFMTYSGKVLWKLAIVPKKWGYSAEEFEIVGLSFTYDYEGENEEVIEGEFDIPGTKISHEYVKTEIKSLPLFLDSLEIDMRHSIDPEDWKIEATLGSDK